MRLKKSITGCCLILFSIIVVFFVPLWIFSLVITILIALGLKEFFDLIKKKGIFVYSTFGVLVGSSIPLIVYLEGGTTYSGDVVFIVLSCFFLFLLQLMRRDYSQALIGISLTLFGILYVSWFFSFFLKLRLLPSGAWWAAYLLAVTKMTDVGAFFVGTVFGRHSLIPHISPGKTKEGTFGGLVFAVLTSLCLGPYLSHHFSWFSLTLMGLLLGMVGQIGDLSESLMKRFCEVKDSGKLLPGFGGVLDSIDSVLFTAPIFYYYLRTLT